MTVRPHVETAESHQSGSNDGGNAAGVNGVLNGSSKISSRSPQRAARRIPPGVVTGEIPLDAAKLFASRLWTGTGIPPRIVYADRNSKGENITLNVKLLPEGAKTAPYPQLVFYVKGMYHIEEISYSQTNPFKWTTWSEFHLNAEYLQALIDALYKAKFALEETMLEAEK